MTKTKKILSLVMAVLMLVSCVSMGKVQAAMGEEAVTIEDVYEPYLMQIGFLTRTVRGRCVTKLAYDHLGIQFNDKNAQQSIF